MRCELSVLEKRVNKGRYRGPLREHEQRTDKQQNDDDRRKPKFLALAHETPKIFQQLNH